MAAITKFEDVIAWQEARKLTKSIYLLTSRGAFARDFGLRDQIQRVAISSMTNIAEGFDCESKMGFGRFLSMARRSAVEVQSLLYVALDAEYIDANSFGQHYEQARKTKALMGGFRKSLARRHLTADT